MTMTMTTIKREPGTPFESEVLAVCWDCLVYTANAELPECDAAERAILDGEKRLQLEGQRQGFPRPHLAADGEELGFSRNPCEVCRRPLGGDRYAATLILGWRTGTVRRHAQFPTYGEALEYMRRTAGPFVLDTDGGDAWTVSHYAPAQNEAGA